MKKQKYFKVKKIKNPNGVTVLQNVYNAEGKIDFRHCSPLDGCGCPEGH